MTKTLKEYCPRVLFEKNKKVPVKFKNIQEGNSESTLCSQKLGEIFTKMLGLQMLFGTHRFSGLLFLSMWLFTFALR